ncbi:MAG TPA: endolytic transglycosylase MltG [Thermoanaerobacterales bacterium]|nr:endolytic transglycosylase MltG [Thermoanaerobacterales bacterium]
MFRFKGADLMYPEPAKSTIKRRNVKCFFTSNRYKSLFSIIFLGLILFSILIYSIFFDYVQPCVVGNNNLEQIVEIHHGQSAYHVAELLHNSHIIKNKRAFVFYVKFKGLDSALKAGKYALSPNMSLLEIVKHIVNGNTINNTVKITIPEGLEIKEIASLLNKKGLVNQERFLKAANTKENLEFNFLDDLPDKASLEGYLFPDTYQVYSDINEIDIIKTMLNRFGQIFNLELVSRAEELDMTIHEVVTLASIIEREAQSDDERAIISSVFHNRLKAGIPLGSCVTVQYALGERKPNLTNKDIEIDSPYNTYKIKGLPPL